MFQAPGSAKLRHRPTGRRWCQCVCPGGRSGLAGDQALPGVASRKRGRGCWRRRRSVSACHILQRLSALWRQRADRRCLGSAKRPPPALAMWIAARATEIRLSSGLPPLAGILRTRRGRSGTRSFQAFAHPARSTVWRCRISARGVCRWRGTAGRCFRHLGARPVGSEGRARGRTRSRMVASRFL